MESVVELVRQFLLGAVGTLSFGLMFGIPRRQYLACAVDGAVGWTVYCIAVLLGASGATASLIAAIPLSVLARIFAVKMRAPATVFLLCGIFPLVPGAGIYHTAYYFILNDQALCLETGINTVKVAVSLAIGMSLVLAFPFPKRKREKRAGTK